MKKTLLLLCAIIGLQIGLAYCAELTCDINNGTLDSLKVGSLTDKNAITRAIGEGPGEIEEASHSSYYFRYYKYSSRGASVTTDVKGGKEYIHDIYISLVDEKKEFGGARRFSGKILPQLSSSDDVKSVKDKFGPPTKEALDDIDIGTMLQYKRPYGWAIFSFDKSGKLVLIDISLENLFD
jgi:hypothetical protein